jgi:hypothetical protein
MVSFTSLKIKINLYTFRSYLTENCGTVNIYEEIMAVYREIHAENLKQTVVRR